MIELEEFDVRITSFILDPCKYREISYPKLLQEKFFGRKAIKTHNQKLINEYNERCRVQKEFINKYYGQKTWEKICKREEERKESAGRILEEIYVDMVKKNKY